MTIVPLVSVVIATYNWQEKRLSQTIDSILNQSYKNMELIIVNDASTNNIEETILKYKEKDDRVIYLKNKKNSERSYSRNRWIFESRWKYIAFCDDDDIWVDKDKIKRQVDFCENNEDYVLCWTSVIEMDEYNNMKDRIRQRSWDEILRNTLLQSNQFALSSIMIRKDVLLYSGLFDSNCNKAEDYDLWLRIGNYWKMENLTDSFICYRIRYWNTSTTSNMWIKKNSFKFMLENRKNYPNFLKALILRIWDIILPSKTSDIILKSLKFKWMLR